MTLDELIEHLKDIAQQYPEMLQDEVFVQDDDGLFVHRVITTEIAGGPWIITETEE